MSNIAYQIGKFMRQTTNTAIGWLILFACILFPPLFLIAIPFAIWAIMKGNDRNEKEGE